MGRIVGSGVHKLKSLFGEAVFEHSKAIQRLRAELHDSEREFTIGVDRQRRKNVPYKTLIFIEVVALTGAVIIWALNKPTEPTTPQTLTALILIAFGVGIIVVSYNSLIAKGAREINEIDYRILNIQSRMREEMDRYLGDVIGRFENLATNRGELARSIRRGDCATLFFCPTHLAMADVGIEEVLLINSVDCRDVQIHVHERERRSVTTGAIDSASDRALQGAMIGALAFGSDGMIAGSVIGSASERRIAVETVETRLTEYVVDIYTRLQHIPVVTIPFGSDERNAKELYAVLSAALPKVN